jgi:hypothetical protein
MATLWWTKKEQLDKHQVALIEQLPLRETFLVLGPPGSGKTNVLLRRAQFVRGQNMPNVLVLALPKGELHKLLFRQSEGIGYGGTTSNAEVSRPGDTAEALKISYEYKREKAGDWGNHKIIPQLAPVTLPRPEEKDQPVKSIFLGPPHTEISTSAMKLPEGWAAEPPQAVHLKCPWVTYDETYRFENGTVYAERKIEVLKERVPVADWKNYKKFTEDADLGNEEYIQLISSREPASPHPSVNGATTRTNDPDAVKLIAAGRLSIQHHDFEAAQSQLDAARSLNPEQKRLWTNYGYLEFQRGNMSAAISDYKKELALYPDNYGTYSSLAEAHRFIVREAHAAWSEIDQEITWEGYAHDMNRAPSFVGQLKSGPLADVTPGS